MKGSLSEIASRAHRGNADAQLELGFRYLRGDGAKRSCAEAEYWIHQAALHGGLQRQLALADLYLGSDCVADDEAGMMWMRKAAQQGDPRAEYVSGMAYAHGQGVGIDFDQSAIWLRKAALQGFGSAQRNLAILYFSGKGVPVDSKQGLAWLRKATDSGDSVAQGYLARVYLHGVEVKQDYVVAYALAKLTRIHPVGGEYDIPLSIGSPMEVDSTFISPKMTKGQIAAAEDLLIRMQRLGVTQALSD